MSAIPPHSPRISGLRRMVGFRNIAVHDDQALQLPMTVRIITGHLDGFLEYSQTLLQRDASPPGQPL